MILVVTLNQWLVFQILPVDITLKIHSWLKNTVHGFPQKIHRAVHCVYMHILKYENVQVEHMINK